MAGSTNGRLVGNPAPIGVMAPTTSPVFVIAAPHSGASGLAWALAQHPEVHTVHGTSWITQLCRSLAAVEHEGRQVRRTRSTITTIGQLTQDGVDGAQFWRAFGAGIEAVVTPASSNGRAVENGGERWVSAEPDLDRIVPALAQAFPAARFVHVVRAPEAAVVAMTTKSRGNPRPMEPDTAAARWAEAIGNGIDAESALGAAVLRVEHQHLADDREATMRHCLEFLGLSWQPSCLRVLRGAASTPPENDLASLGQSTAIAHAVERLAQPRARTARDIAAARDRLDDCLHAHAGIRARPTGAERQGEPDLVPPASGELSPFDRFRLLVLGCVPPAATVAVVSRGDDALIELSGRVGMHYPQTDAGVYAGHHPANSEDAVAHLRALRDRGVSHLAIPPGGFWWLDYYRGLREHLLSNGHVVGYQAGAGVVFGLDTIGAKREGVLRLAYRGTDVDVGTEPTADSAGTAGPGSEAALGNQFRDANDQFIIWQERTDVIVPEGWPVHRTGRWHLASHPALPVRPLRDRASRRLGFVVGHAIGSGVSLGPDPISLDVHAGDKPTALEDALYSLGGRWVAIVDTPSGPRLHLDAGGTLAVVHARDQQVAASTTTLLHAALDGPDAPKGTGDEFPANRTNGFLAAGLTNLDWARRVLPNHYLDLDAWTPERHWPAGEIDKVDEIGLVPELHNIASGLSTVLAGLAESYDLQLGLTAGRDSRVLLACGRAVRDAIDTFTFDYGATTPGAATDIVTARELARIADVPHRVVPVGDTTEPERDAYLERIGYAGNWGKARDFGALDHHVKLGGALVPGFLGGLGRGHFWPQTPKRVEALTDEVLLRRLRMPDTPALRHAMQEWRSALPPVDARLLLDLLYLEHRGGCWASPHLYGTPSFAAVVVPFASRQVLHSMFRLPHAYRAKKRLYPDLVRMTWPELADLPFQTLPDGGQAS